MAVGLAEIVICCLIADRAFKALKLPGLIGRLFVGAALESAILGCVLGARRAKTSKNRLVKELLARGLGLPDAGDDDIAAELSGADAILVSPVLIGERDGARRQAPE